VKDRLVRLEVAPVVREALSIEDAADDHQTFLHPLDLL
jgi:hypothetical protein